MTHRENSLQQLDPLGGMAARSITVSGAIGMVLFAIAMTAASGVEMDYPRISGVALGVVGAAAVILIFTSSPLRAPMTRSVHLVVMGLAMLSLVLNAVSMWESNTYIQDDWGPLIVGLSSLLLAPYRPARELAAVGAFAAIFTGLLALAQASAMETPLPAIVFVVIAVTPILAMSLGGAVFSSTIVRTLRRWQARATSAVRAHGDERQETMARSVQQDRVTILNRDVVPFFAEVLDRDQITDADRARASEISDSIRRVMVAEVDRTWLDVVIEQVAASRGIGAIRPVRDDQQLAVAMSPDQRTATRAMVVALFGHPAFEPDGFDVRIAREDDTNVVTIRAGFARGETGIRSDLAPYLAVLRIVFLDLQAEFASPTLLLRFSYDQ